MQLRASVHVYINHVSYCCSTMGMMHAKCDSRKSWTVGLFALVGDFLDETYCLHILATGWPHLEGDQGGGIRVWGNLEPWISRHMPV